MNFSEAPDKNNWISGLAANHLGYILFALPIVALFFISKEFDYTKCRLSATIVAYTSLKIFYPLEKLTSTGPPVSYYAIIAYANCMSTWFQYESLLYVSFPIQVVAKSIKTIPVMIVGKLVS
ncbi:unnamed protein product, partial [Adineta steineri]